MKNAANPNNKATVSSKGQVVIPLFLRKKLGIHAGNELLFKARPDGVLEVKPIARSIDQFFGRCKRKKESTMSIKDMDAAIMQAVSDNDASSSGNK